MSNPSRTGFQGFTFMRSQDTDKHEVEIGKIEDGGQTFGIKMIRSVNFPDGNFLVSEVQSVANKPLWKFQDEKYEGLGLLAKVGDAIVIALVGFGKSGKVERVIPLRNLLNAEQADLRTMIQLKIGAANFLKRDHALTTAESIVHRIDDERRRAEREATEKAAAEAREKAREERLKTLLARGQVTCYTADGKKRYGIPVLANEWMSCTPGTFVVLVDSIDESGKIGNVIEAFQVVKERGKNPKKGSPAPVTLVQPEVKKPVVVQPIRTAVCERESLVYEVRLYASQEQILAAQKAGLNSGALVAVDSKDKDGKIAVQAVHRDRIEAKGKFSLLN